MTNRPEMRREGGREEGAYGRKSENFPSPSPSNGGRGEGGAAVGWPVAPVVAALPPSMRSVATGINSPDFTSDENCGRDRFWCSLVRR